LISTLIQVKVNDQPSYRPVDIINDMRREQGVHLEYHKAWRAKEKAVIAINGSHESAYNDIPKYCEDILRTNPGSTVVLERDGDNRFQRMFVSFAASGAGFAYCRPVLGLDGTHLKSRFKGILLSATAVDAKGSLFPLAYAVVDAENDKNWAWFVECLRTVIQQHAPAYLTPGKLTFLSDRQKGLLEAVERLLPGSPHGYCLRHLYDNFHKEFKTPILQTFLYNAARATSAEAFNTEIEKMREVNPASVVWLLSHANPEHWVEFYFAGHRYGHLTSNIAESLNNWIKEAREKPILAMFEQIRHQLMKLFNTRRESETDVPGLLVSDVAKDIQTLLSNYGRRYRIISSDGDVYEIFSLETSRNCVVRLHAKTCTCWSWQLSGIPCGHALAVSLNRKENPQTYAHSFYHLDEYHQTYQKAIYPPNTDDADNPGIYTLTSDDDSDSDDALLPPITRRAPGRPKKRRIRGANESGDCAKRIFRCSRCQKPGHSRRTCAEPL
jgi:MULE transposase domain/SWIM zinc finger